MVLTLIEFVTVADSYLPVFVLTTKDSLFSKSTPDSKSAVSFQWLLVSVSGLSFPHVCPLNSGRGSLSDLEKIYDDPVIVHFSLLKGSYKG